MSRLAGILSDDASLAPGRPANATAIAVAPVPAEGLGKAINDRLARAAVRS